MFRFCATLALFSLAFLGDALAAEPRKAKKSDCLCCVTGQCDCKDCACCPGKANTGLSIGINAAPGYYDAPYDAYPTVAARFRSGRSGGRFHRRR